MVNPYVNTGEAMSAPKGAVLVSYAFEDWILVLLHNCLHRAHYCASTNFHGNEYKEEDTRMGPPVVVRYVLSSISQQINGYVRAILKCAKASDPHAITTWIYAARVYLSTNAS